MTAARTSLVPIVRAALFDLLTGGMTGPKVHYGWDGNKPGPDRVIVGGVAEEDVQETFQSFGGPSNLARQENFRLLVGIRVTAKGIGCQAAYERAYGWLAQLEDLLRADEQMGMADDGVQLAAIDQVRESEDWADEGWRCAIDVYVRFQTQT